MLSTVGVLLQKMCFKFIKPPVPSSISKTKIYPIHTETHDLLLNDPALDKFNNKKKENWPEQTTNKKNSLLHNILLLNTAHASCSTIADTDGRLKIKTSDKKNKTVEQVDKPFLVKNKYIPTLVPPTVHFSS